MRNLKKIIALVAVFAMLVSTVAFAGTFSDVADTDNYAKAIELLNDLGIVTGDDEDGDGVMDFRPEDTITRAEVTAIIARIQGMDVAAQTATEFEDVPATHWASGYVAQAASQGIVNGYGDGKFGPEDNVTYEQMIKMLMETLGYRPFAADNGGYPTGYVTAATRYGVLDDVVGGGIGVEASRGMVAQMVYNAINTPLMDPVTYGTDKEYGIYDGVNYKLMTLLTRDLKMIKFTGIVTANSLSGSIDTTARKTVTVAPYQTADNGYYLGWVNSISGGISYSYIATPTLYQGEVDCDPFLGYAVEVYAKKMSNFESNYTVIAMEKQTVNSEIEFAADLFTSYTQGTGVVEYLKDATSNVEIAKTIQADATIIYNGIPVAVDNTNGTTADDSRVVLANYLGGIITLGNSLSGKVTLLDTDNNPAYDVVNIEIAVTAVVKEVTNRGQVRFFITPSVPVAGGGTASVRLIFDENDTDTIINLTKNGEAIDYTELEKWDVVSIVWDGVKDVYNVTVLDEGNYVDGAVSVAKSNGDVVLTDGNTYEIASNAYMISAATAEPGMSGRFYVDAYGKIVALDDAVEIEGVNTKVDQYAYVLAAEAKEGNWTGEKVVYVKLLDMSGEVYDAKLASKVKLVNFDQHVGSGEIGTLVGTDGRDASSNVKKSFTTVVEQSAAAITDLDAFAAKLVNTVIAYEGNNAGDVKTIVATAAANSERDLALIADATVGGVKYNADALTFKNGIAVNEDTKVFYIAPKTSNVTYGSNGTLASEENSSVATIASLIDDETYYVAGFAPDANDEAQVVVLMNENGRLAPSTNIAVIDSTGVTVVNGTDAVYTVAYYMNGELQTATTKADMATESVIAAANRGDVVQLTVENGVITFAKAVMNFNGLVDGTAYDKNIAATPAFVDQDGVTPGIQLLAAPGSLDEQYLFGAVTKFSNNGTALVQPLNADGSVNGGIQYVKEADANVYVYDVNMKADWRLSVGSLGDADVDDDLMLGSATVTLEDGTTTTSTPAYGMMDYVFVRIYNNKPADIVVYKNYNFGKYTVQ